MEELLAANRNYYTTALKTGTHIACFAYVNEKIVGCGGVCFYQEMPSPDNPNGCCAYLMNIFTIPEMRKQGIGKAIIKWLVREAQEHGAEKIYLEASQKAYPLYKEMGFYDMIGYLKYEKRI
ncbi:MAG: GNAT family N-acetyltransferase [Clostridiales bacterium]|nr:GNAT family N-acetyltransferase [Clostridiales bacterium]